VVRAVAERPFVLGDWLVDPVGGVLKRRDGDNEIRLEPQTMALLLLFAASPGSVIAKDTIIASVWRGRAIGDDTLAAAISKLRTALGETKDTRYIETLPKRGYRLLALPQDEGPAHSSQEVPEAAALIARGRAALRLPTLSAIAQARLYFEGAIKADPKSAQAQLALADAMLLQNMMGLGDAALLLPAARNAARAALALDDGLAPAWAALGYATLLIERDFAGADAALLKAIALDPGLGSARRYRAFALLAVGRFVDAERESRARVEIEPLSLSARGDLLQILLMARRYAPAIAEAKRALSLAPQSHDALFAKGWAHFHLGEEREAADALLEGLHYWGGDAATLARLKQAFADGGFARLASQSADLFQSAHVLIAPRPLDVAILRALAGESDAAFAALDEAASRGDPYLLLLPYMPHLDRLRNDPRFGALLDRVRVVH
jgi:DNA-binding winged helix-turn-helix (wHTH) protein